MTTDWAIPLCSSASLQRAITQPSYLQQQPGWNAAGRSLRYPPKHRSARRRRGLLKQYSHNVIKKRSWNSLHSLMFAVLFSVLFCSHGVNAGYAHPAHRLGATELLFDRSEPPVPLRLRASTTNSLHIARDHGSDSSPNSSIDKKGSSSQIPLPSPFDTSLGNNFTSQSCPVFFQSFLTDPTFNDCLPFSLLLQVCEPAVFLLLENPQLTTETDVERLLCCTAFSAPAHSNS